MKSFFNKINKIEDGCWLWTGSLTHNGYGQIRVKNINYRAHRYAYELFIKPIPKYKLVCHSCDVRNCVNPTHLFLGSSKDNTNDMLNKGRHVSRKKTKCINNHNFNGDNLYLSPDGRRNCRSCQKHREIKYRKRLNATY